jgi:NAD(P)-dependent dehydrogenase (short-subunit alcohol dehydrogenase family)
LAQLPGGGAHFGPVGYPARMQLHLTLITGASRGLGRAMAEQRLAAGHRVLAMSRQVADLAGASSELFQWPVDLIEAGPTASRMADWLVQQGALRPASVTLINNAAMLSRPGPLAEVPIDELARAARVGLEAPMLLSAAFLRATAAWTVPRKLLLISSGLGRHAMAGGASYCAVKAGLDHLARALALEEAKQPNGARVVSLAPGVIDTDMQVQLREADGAEFAERERFLALKAGGQLDSPGQAAAKVLGYLDRADFGAQPVADVRDR